MMPKSKMRMTRMMKTTREVIMMTMMATATLMMTPMPRGKTWSRRRLSADLRIFRSRQCRNRTVCGRRTLVVVMGFELKILKSRLCSVATPKYIILIFL